MSYGEYLDGWIEGTTDGHKNLMLKQAPKDGDWKRGYDDGMNAYFSASRKEREQIESRPCKTCGGAQVIPGSIVPDAPFAMTYHREMVLCPRCGGSGKGPSL